MISLHLYIPTQHLESLFYCLNYLNEDRFVRRWESQTRHWHPLEEASYILPLWTLVDYWGWEALDTYPSLATSTPLCFHPIPLPPPSSLPLLPPSSLPSPTSHFPSFPPAYKWILHFSYILLSPVINPLLHTTNWSVILSREIFCDSVICTFFL